MDAPIDPSWLPATAATCATTFVAIVGGLLAARNVAVASERGASAERVRTLDGLLEQADAKVGEGVDVWVDVVAEQWLHQVLRYLIDMPDLSAGELLRRQGTQASEAQLSPYVAGWEQTVRRMNSRIDMLLHAGQLAWPRSWPNAKDLLDVALATASDELIAAGVYEARYVELAGDGAGETVERMPVAPPRGEYAFRLQVAQSRLAEATGARRELATRLAVAQAEATVAESARVADTATAITLAVFAVAGIGWPLTSIAIGLHNLWSGLRWIDVAAIVLGIPLVLWLLLGNPDEPAGGTPAPSAPASTTPAPTTPVSTTPAPTTPAPTTPVSTTPASSTPAPTKPAVTPAIQSPAASTQAVKGPEQLPHGDGAGDGETK